jgi:hypothetical protein
MKTNFKFLALFLLFFGLQAQAGLLFTYHKLALKDLDQMNALVSDKIKESKKSSSGKVVPLKEGLQAVLSRPDGDGMVSKVITPLKNELEEQNAWEKTLRELTDEALNALKNPKNFKGDVQATYAIFLENLMAELKPDAAKEGFERKTIKKIKDAKIKLSKESQAERKLRLMKTPISPSEMADMILQSTKVEEPKEIQKETPKATHKKPSESEEPEEDQEQ